MLQNEAAQCRHEAAAAAPRNPLAALARVRNRPAIRHDKEAAARSPYGGLIASGWHTALIWMKLMIAYRHARVAAGAEQTQENYVSPGFRELKWLKPVYVGDTISYASEIVERRVTKSRPGWGIVFARNTGTNQKGELVLSFIGSGFVERQPGAA